MMNVAVLFEKSRRVAAAFESKGCKATSYDLLPAEVEGRHIQGDVRSADLTGFDIIICHPPCTRLCNSGVRWLNERNLWHEMVKAAELFKWCLNLPCKRIAVENPIPHHYALELIGRKYDQIIQPYYFGEAESKATCLWLRGLPPLMFKFSGGEGIKQSVHLEPPSRNRAINRARTFQSIAEAMADQWSNST